MSTALSYLLLVTDRYPYAAPVLREREPEAEREEELFPTPVLGDTF